MGVRVAVGLDGAQTWVDVVGGAAVAIIGFIMNGIRADHRDLRKDHTELADSLPSTYARRDDVKAAFEDLKTAHREMNAKLDRLLMRP